MLARSSYADNSQRLPIVVEQAGFFAFSRVDVPTAHPAPLQSPSVHWRKRLACDYVQPHTGLGDINVATPTGVYADSLTHTRWPTAQ